METVTPVGRHDTALYSEDKNMQSVVSYPERCAAWGNASYRGNCDGRLFLNLVLRYRARSIGDPMRGSGTTRDVALGLIRGKHAQVTYWGSDLREGFDLGREELPGRFDFVWIHPPYWNMVRYSNDERDLSNAPTYEEFFTRLTVCLERCAKALNPDGHLAVLIGDMRRQGAYFPMGRDVMQLEGKLGRIRSVIIKAQHNCASDRRVYTNFQDPPIKHEYCVVFQNSAR